MIAAVLSYCPNTNKSSLTVKFTVMDKKEQFKRAFIKQCADDGLTLAQTVNSIHLMANLTKEAGLYDEVAKAGVGGGKALGGWTLGMLKNLLLAAPPLAGIAGGAMLGTMHNEPYDIKELRKLEEADELERAIKLLSKR